MCTHLYYSSWARPCQPTSACMSACPLQHGAGAEYSDPATNHGSNPSAGIPGRPEQPRRQAQEPPESPWRCHGIPRGSRRASARSGAVRYCLFGLSSWLDFRAGWNLEFHIADAWAWIAKSEFSWFTRQEFEVLTYLKFSFAVPMYYMYM